MTYFEQLSQTRLLDRPKLTLELERLKRKAGGEQWACWQQRCAASMALVEQRRASVPKLDYDEALPIAAKRQAIKEALLKHQVLIIGGETGSGKTTQLPKICLEAGLGCYGLIGHTQPRRLAARSVAARISEEIGGNELVGYQVRFEDKTSPNALIKLMTDGILLAEIQQDPDLLNYECIIVDEAHERSLNIDFLLGYLKTLLARRSNLKLIITSATLELERFSQHFAAAPIIEVSGRSYPVDTWYRPLLAEQDEGGERLSDERDTAQAILAALDELSAFERGSGKRPGDVLVFLPGEREIREVAAVLRRADLRFCHILPLYARLSAGEQQKIFAQAAGRKIVLSTNVAETSLTVPGIRYVIDAGSARISRYSYRRKVQRLPIEAISQASANQRKGRCGRTEPGICVRLYSEADFLARPEFTEPQILRTHLGAVILQMLHLRLGDVQAFPFIDKPDGKAIRDGFKLLEMLGAVNDDERLTPLGRQLARLPIDPRIGRMVLQGARLGSLDDVLIVASALSVQDARLRPPESTQAADQAQAKWKDKDSDFASLINLWRDYEQQRQDLGSSALRTWCKKHFLSELRLREWRDAHRQLRLLARELKLANDPMLGADHYARLHQAILSGLLDQIGQKSPDNKDKGDYLGARGLRFWLHPSSSLSRKKPDWLMSAELTETSRLYARLLARIDPAWLEALAAPLIKRSYNEPHWEKKRGQLVAYEQLSLFGLIIVPRRAVHYGPMEPALARELLIRQGLVEGEINSRARCLSANRELLKRLDVLEAKARRRDILVDDEQLFAFYDARLPQDIIQAASFERWYKKQSQIEPDLLIMREADLLQEAASIVSAAHYPDELTLGALKLPLSYQFEPGHPRDGVTLRVPAPLLRQLPAERLHWLVPGLLQNKCLALVRALPKALRKNFVPAPDFVRAALQSMSFAEGCLTAALGRELQRMTGVAVPPETWQTAEAVLENHLLFNIEVTDENGKALGEGRHLDELIERFAQQAQASLRPPPQALSEHSAVQAKDFALKAEQTQSVGGLNMPVFPALMEQGSEVIEAVFATQDEADIHHRHALQRLLLQHLSAQAAHLRKNLLRRSELGLLYREYGRLEALVEDILLASVDHCMLAATQPLPRSSQALLNLAESRRSDWQAYTEQLAALTLQILKQAQGLRPRLSGKINLAHAMSLADIKQQLKDLIYPGFIRQTPGEWLTQLPRYLTAIEKRLEKLPGQLVRERLWTAELCNLREQYQAQASKALAPNPLLAEYRWLLEEYRVSLFAQTLGTRSTVSAKRLQKLWQQLTSSPC
ncbi:ATP-dependent RNA helicase HrpA [Ventosimonas gracilis]|uniref:ATP-dependent RNA helicase HrpA n=1 Tax=Ventosimonas gracilis TaxID=1680762 RepID=A0A139SQG7_9GAMM|nr:ATP-dependent RNA helicase HrpA [Ventosimonas gracilis]KXU36777.1 ATP-dependent RNA helicase HrpA [Ventosimonas gracilis]